MHIPVLQKEVLEYFDPKPNENFVDCTVGEGGHALSILEKTGPNGKILGIEWDEQELKKLEGKIKNPDIKKRLIFTCGSYTNLKEIIKENLAYRQAGNFNSISGILLDLGMSSWHLEESKRGFSFLKNEPLDMRYNSTNQLTAEKILNFWSELDIEKIIKEYGEERFAKSIAKNIISFRQIKPIENTFQLVEIIRTSLPARTLFHSGIKRAVPFKYQRGRIHPATRTFQALRIAVNDELNNLNNVLPQALEVLKTNGKLIVISFHSLEDRIVKNFFRDKQKENLVKILTKKPVVPLFQEIKNNPRSRSSKLRTIIKIN